MQSITLTLSQSHHSHHSHHVFSHTDHSSLVLLFQPRLEGAAASQLEAPRVQPVSAASHRSITPAPRSTTPYVDARDVHGRHSSSVLHGWSRGQKCAPRTTHKVAIPTISSWVDRPRSATTTSQIGNDPIHLLQPARCDGGAEYARGTSHPAVIPNWQPGRRLGDGWDSETPTHGPPLPWFVL